MSSCKMRGNLDNVVIIDLDADGIDDVIIIDGPQSLEREFSGAGVPKDGKSFPSIICIDDDECYSGDDHREFNMEEDGGFNCDDNDVQNKISSASDFVQESQDEDADDDCRVVLENRPTFKLSKCGKAYTKQSPSRNCYGLNSESETESDSSESSSSDCEVLEGAFSELGEQRVKAFHKRTSNADYKGCQSGLQDQANPCSLHTDAHPNVNMKKTSIQNIEVPVCFSSKNVNFQEANCSDFTAAGDKFIGGSFNNWMEHSFAESDDRIGKEFSWWWKQESRENTYSHWKADVPFTGECMDDINLFYDESQSENVCGPRFQNETEGPLGCSPLSIYEEGTKQCQDTSSHFQQTEQNTMEECSLPNSELKPNLSSDYERSNIQYKDPSLCKLTNKKISSAMEKDGKFTPVISSISTCSNGAQCQNFYSKKKDKLIAGSSCHMEGEKPANSSSINLPTSNGKDPSDVLFGDVSSAVQTDIINEREKIKETNEFKRAVEEEWAARQLQLKVQAEEVQRLRKRKKAERLRILDMEKRLKQRVEEVRETQRKDEEYLKMKENLRAEVRKELFQLENTCIDMASLLRGLGIQVGGGFLPLSQEVGGGFLPLSQEVGGGFLPLSQEVHAAYKQALLKFHPDRASRTDVRQQVEAEEKFKLISRMKEKFLSILCC